MERGTDWEKLRLEYIHGTMSFQELAKRHGASFTAIKKQAQRNHWTAQRRQLSQQVTRVAEQTLTEKRLDLLQELNNADINLSKKIRMQIDAHIVKAKASGKNISPKDLKSLASAAESAQRLARLALGVNTENHVHTGANGGPIAQATLTITPEQIAKADEILDMYIGAKPYAKEIPNE